MSTRIACISLGCSKNRVDSEVMLGHLREAGYDLTNDMKMAEIIIVNTCGFITDAKKESISAILEAAQFKKTDNCRYLLIAGCLSQRYGHELLNELPEIDGVMGTGSITEVVSVLNRMQAGERPNVVTSPGHIYHGLQPRVLTTPQHTAYLKIADGCDNCCSYCAIPAIRGPYSSRAIEDVLAEAQELCNTGVKELIVVAQESTRYGVDLYGKYALAELLQGLVEVKECHWIRLMYCYPTTFSEQLIELMASSPKICSYVDLPLQHINNRILRMMNRRGSKEDIVNLIEKLRRMINKPTLRTTFIIGFPGETEQEYQELLDFMRYVKFERVGVFGFCPEEGTPAATLPGRLNDETIAERVEQAMLLQQSISLAHNQNAVGQEITVLVEGWDDDINMYWGRTEADAPEIDGKVFFASHENVQKGNFIKVKILDATEYDLTGVRKNELA